MTIAAIAQSQCGLFPEDDGGSIPTLPLQIREIHQATAKDLISKFHYLGVKAFRCGYAFGLYENGTLIGAIVYHGLSAPETAVGAFGLQRDDQDGLWEIGRLVLIPSANGGNRGSFLIRRSLMLLRRKACVRALISYADSRFHSGTIYKAAGFTYCGLTAKKCDYVINGKIQERGETRNGTGAWVERPRKHRFALTLDKTLMLRWNTQQKSVKPTAALDRSRPPDSPPHAHVAF